MIKALAQQVAKLSQQVAALSRMRIDGFGRSGSGASGAIVFTRTIGRSADPYYTPPKTVVIVAKPRETTDYLLVRGVRYADDVPRRCTKDGTPVVTTCYYEWDGDPFEAYPPLGKEAIDYDGDEFTKQLVDDPLTKVIESGPAPPEIDTVFHRCHRENEVWVMDHQAEGGGGGETTFAVVRATYATGTPDERKVLVQKVIFTNAGTIEFGSQATTAAWVWPGLFSENYAAFVWQGAAIQPQTVIVAVTKVNGASYVEQWSGLRYRLLKRSRSVRVTDCVLQGAGM
jgi:hypothetical protein